ncbi:unnamed protein product [Closterium sp. Yama58-4]|nr:unnamed protein product [Closterium sp. Yama58-4]
MIRNSSRGSSLHLAVPLNPSDRPSPRDSSMSHPLSHPSSQSPRSSQNPWSSLHHRARAVVTSRTDWLLVFALLLVNIALSRYLPPYQRFIPPETLHSPRYPVVDNPGAAFFTTASLLAPLLVFVKVLLPQPNLLDLHILGLVYSVQITWLAATLLQCAIGRPRPSFLSACLQGSEPVVSPSAGVTCVPPPAYLYYYRKSFPSAHAAVSFSAAVFLLLFLSRTIQQSFPQRPSHSNSPSLHSSSHPSHRSNHSQHRTQSHQECNQPLQNPQQPHQAPDHTHENATSSSQPFLIATPLPIAYGVLASTNQPLAARLRDSLHASHLWRVPAVAWPLALAAGAGLADLDTYSNAPGDILAGVALGTLVAVILYWRVFPPPRCGLESRVFPGLGFEPLRDGSPPPEPPSADTRLEVLVPAAFATTALATAPATAAAVAAAAGDTARGTRGASADNLSGKEG